MNLAAAVPVMPHHHGSPARSAVRMTTARIEAATGARTTTTAGVEAAMLLPGALAATATLPRPGAPGDTATLPRAPGGVTTSAVTAPGPRSPRRSSTPLRPRLCPPTPPSTYTPTTPTRRTASYTSRTTPTPPPRPRPRPKPRPRPRLRAPIPPRSTSNPKPTTGIQGPLPRTSTTIPTNPRPNIKSATAAILPAPTRRGGTRGTLRAINSRQRTRRVRGDTPRATGHRRTPGTAATTSPAPAGTWRRRATAAPGRRAKRRRGSQSTLRGKCEGRR